MHLSEFLEIHNITQKRMAKTLGISKMTLYRYKKGKTVPNRGMKRLIEIETMGEVATFDWNDEENNQT